MLKLTRLRRGLTLIETVLTLGTLVLAASLAIPMYRIYIMRNDLELARQSIAQMSQRAKFNSQVVLNDSEWGFVLDAVPGRAILFMGSTYASRNADFDELYTLPSTIGVDGITEVAFAKITGLPNRTGDIILTALNGEQRRITINLGYDGNLEVQDDWMTICYQDANIQVPDSLWQYYNDRGATLGVCSGSESGGSTCGNSQLEGDEECDDGGESVSCNTNCTDSACGDGILNTTAGETCDDGNTASDDGCTGACLLEVCGDNIIQTGEECDDGNTSNGDGCDSLCRSETCGNGVLQSGEQCDDGNTANNDGCSSTCATELCGDNTVQGSFGEECDDGNTSNGDGCDSLCRDELCGNSIIQSGEQCDDGNTASGDGCDDKCNTEAACGNGAVEGGEECDDSNTTNGDGCDAACNLEICGNSLVQTGEECDDGNTTDDDGCSSQCNNEVCGDGIVHTGEQCDDGNTARDDGCSETCQNEVCGDGVVQNSEECDDGNTTSNDGCSAVCENEVCGDGIVQTSEECDDGNTTNDDGCSYICNNEVCGDGVTQTGEACDDGNTSNGDGCDSTCEIETTCTSNCVPVVIDDDELTPHIDYECNIRVIGSDIGYSDGTQVPVTMRVRYTDPDTGTHSWVEPFGSFTLPVTGNVNDDDTHNLDCSTWYESGTTVNVEARSWIPDYWELRFSTNNNDYQEYRTEFTGTSNEDNVWVLRDGDSVPTVLGGNGQQSVADYVSDYIDSSDNTMNLSDNEFIYLFELTHDGDSTSSGADFQDLVIIITISEKSS